MDDQTHRRATHWSAQLAPIGAIRFDRCSLNFRDTVRFYRDLAGLPLFETLEDSYGSTGAMFGLPSWNLTLEIVESVEPVTVDPHDQLCLYFPDQHALQAATAGLRAAAAEPVPQYPYWEATGAITYRNPDDREVVFAPFVFGVNEPAGSDDSGRHEFPPR